MLVTKRKPVSVGEMLKYEYMEPLGLTQQELANAMGVQRRLVNELCMSKRSVTVKTAYLLGRVLGNSAEFWLNTQKRWDLWIFVNSDKFEEEIAKAKPIHSVDCV